ncbi:hypothetical protein EHS25_008447 [Saitozyma podzolica]|uniref:Uncharacterized protein n=1 Tax=Saitozyma podzolica TaxID=1890683 RepID=A0A427YPJ7_9TREE|nr:hypothetical protein EHS25_008447 [Saitozyma podzolica]
MSVASSDTVHSRTDVVVYPTELELSGEYFTFQAKEGIPLSDYVTLATAFRHLSLKQAASGFLARHGAFDAAFLGFRKLTQDGGTEAEGARDSLRADDEQELQTVITTLKNLGARDSKLGGQSYAQVARFHEDGSERLASLSRDMRLVKILSAQLRDGLKEGTVSQETLERSLNHRSSCLLSAAKQVQHVSRTVLANEQFEVHLELLPLIEASPTRYPRLEGSVSPSTDTLARSKSRKALADRESEIHDLIQTANTQWKYMTHPSSQRRTSHDHRNSFVNSLEQIMDHHAWELQYQTELMRSDEGDGVSQGEADSRASSSADSILKRGSSRGMMGSMPRKIVKGLLGRNKVGTLLEASAKLHKSAPGTILELPEGVPITNDSTDG